MPAVITELAEVRATPTRRFALYTTTLMHSGFYLKGDRLWVYNQK
ncbi:MAG: hypothetical protein RM347_013780 [Nostoc sp. ChiQUE02]|nr:hypothetical protein [Nostoc sp. ChiQUE02]MDZ8231608.1 hypothetical protein [Nostoc sp. ChiQUE02]